MADTSVRGLADEVERLAVRLRSMSDVRLGRALASGATGAAAGLEVAQGLADAAHGIEQRELIGPPHQRRVPDLGVFAVGDQVAVTGADLARLAGALPEDTMVWYGSARAQLGEVIGTQAAAVRALRLTL